MGDKIFDTTLECGCMIAHDSGYPNDIQGDGGLMDCYCQYEEDEIKKERLMDIHIKAWDKHYKECEECGGDKYEVDKKTHY